MSAVLRILFSSTVKRLDWLSCKLHYLDIFITNDHFRNLFNLKEEVKMNSIYNCKFVRNKKNTVKIVCSLCIEKHTSEQDYECVSGGGQLFEELQVFARSAGALGMRMWCGYGAWWTDGDGRCQDVASRRSWSGEVWEGTRTPGRRRSLSQCTTARWAVSSRAVELSAVLPAVRTPLPLSLVTYINIFLHTVCSVLFFKSTKWSL